MKEPELKLSSPGPPVLCLSQVCPCCRVYNSCNRCYACGRGLGCCRGKLYRYSCIAGYYFRRNILLIACCHYCKQVSPCRDIGQNCNSRAVSLRCKGVKGYGCTINWITCGCVYNFNGNKIIVLFLRSGRSSCKINNCSYRYSCYGSTYNPWKNITPLLP